MGLILKLYYFYYLTFRKKWAGFFYYRQASYHSMHCWIKLDLNSYRSKFSKLDVTSSGHRSMVISKWHYLLTSMWFLVVPMIKNQINVSFIVLIFFARAKLLKKIMLIFFTYIRSWSDYLNYLLLEFIIFLSFIQISFRSFNL